jgi:hypothetical protein
MLTIEIRPIGLGVFRQILLWLWYVCNHGSPDRVLLFPLEFRDYMKVVELRDYLRPLVNVAVLADLGHIVHGGASVWLVLGSEVVYCARWEEGVVLKVRLSVGSVAL